MYTIINVITHFEDETRKDFNHFTIILLRNMIQAAKNTYFECRKSDASLT